MEFLSSQMLVCKRGGIVHLGRTEYFVAVLNNELHGCIFGMHVSHFSINAVISHDRWREDHCKILGCHL
jgi:hypothetical protein